MRMNDTEQKFYVGLRTIVSYKYTWVRYVDAQVYQNKKKVCGITHKYTKYTEALQCKYLYYKHFIYCIVDHFYMIDLKSKRICIVHFMGGYQPLTLVYVTCIDACVSTMIIAALSVMCLLLFSFTIFVQFSIVNVSYSCTDI